jgi:uncharacterized Zn finger protein
MEAKRICDKCGSTNFVLNMYIHQIGGMPFTDYVHFCEECGEMHEEYRKQYCIESANLLTGEVKLKNKNK